MRADQALPRYISPLGLLQPPPRIDHFARYEENLSHSSFINALQNDSTALILGQTSPTSLVNNLSEYVRSSDLSFYQVLSVSAESVETDLRRLLSILNFNPPTPTLEQLIVDIVSDVSHFTAAIASPFVELSIILQDRTSDLELEIELAPTDLEMNELIDLMYHLGVVHHLDERCVNQIKIYSGPSTYCLDPFELQRNFRGESPENWIYQLSKERFYRRTEEVFKIDHSEVLSTRDELLGIFQPAQICDFGDEEIALRPLQFQNGFSHLFFGAKQQFVDAGYASVQKCLFHARPVFTDRTASRRFLTILTSPEDYRFPFV